jgi:hypothetical protein
MAHTLVIETRETQMTKTEQALTIWNEMSPMDRMAIMQKVADVRSMTKKFRACIEYIAQTMVGA